MIEEVIALTASRRSPLLQSFRQRVLADGGTVELSEIEIKQQYAILPKALWAIIVCARKAGKLYAIYPNLASSDLVFSRNSKSTALNASGKLIEEAVNMPAFDWVDGHTGVNISPQATNIIPNNNVATYNTPEDVVIESFAWPHTAIYTHAVHFVNNAVFRSVRKNFTCVNGVRYCASAFVIMDDGGMPGHIQIPGQYHLSDFFLKIDNTVYSPTSPVITNPPVHVGNNVWLVSVSKVCTAPTSSNQLRVTKESINTARGFRTVGLMINEGYYPARHIVTTTAVATKLFDNTETAKVIPMQDIVLFAEMSLNYPLGTTTLPLGFSLKADASNYLTIGYNADGTIAMAIVQSGTVAIQINASHDPRAKVAARFRNNDFALFVNGVKYTIPVIGDHEFNHSLIQSTLLQLGHMNRNINIRSAAVREYGDDLELINLTRP